MKYLSSLVAGAALAGLALTARAQSVGIGPNGYSPDTKAALDISSGSGANKGLLIPRVTASQRANITSSTEAMLVYQTDGTQPGFWYYTNAAWVPLPSGVSSSAGWLTTGNSGTAPGTFTGVGASTNGVGGTSFIGTTDNADLVFRTGNAERLRVTTDGSLYSRSAYGLILSAADAPLITRGWDTFQTGSYKGLGRWGLFMRASQLALGIPNAGGKHFAWVTWNDDSSVGSTLMTLTQEGNLALGLNGTALSPRFSLVGTGTSTPATANSTQSTGHLVRLRDNGNVALDLGSAGTTGGIWLQSTDPTNLATNYPLALNPNCGNVGVGTGTTAPTSTLSVDGAMSVPYTTTGNATSFTLTNAHQTLRRFSPCTTITLPGPGTCLGRLYTIINSNGTNSDVALTVANSGGVYDDVTNTTLTALPPNNRISIQSDGTNWIVVGR